MSVLLTASDLYTYYRPSKCDLRVYLRHRGEEESPPGPYDQVIKRLGIQHEKAHLSSFPVFVDLSLGGREERAGQTQAQIAKRSPIIYHALLGARTVLEGVECEVVGEPDFLICCNNGYAIRDAKISRMINEKDHPEILRQLELYGWIYEETFGEPPSALQVHSGTAEIVQIPYAGGQAALGTLRRILELKRADSEPYTQETPVGWSKCGECAFRDRCWKRAEDKREVAIVPEVDQGLAFALRQNGTETLDQLIGSFNEERLAGVERPWGDKSQRVGKKAVSIIRNARAIASHSEILLETPLVPDHPNYVMFDIEGLPPHLDELEKIYLWGLKVFGESPSEYHAATAGFAAQGDREGWEGFLANAQSIFQQYGDLPFVHWHHYEPRHLRMYVDRFGDHCGVARRVQGNLLDLFRITSDAIVLPLPSYSLKVVEQYVGFKRTEDEYGGRWAMAKYIEATETEDERVRSEVLRQILSYNREDLEATWAVLNWLRTKAP